MIQLDEKSNEINQIKKLIPFIYKKIMKSFGKNLISCSLLYNFHKKGIISKDDFINHIKNNCNDDITYSEKNELIYYTVMSWFFPELIQLNLIENGNIFLFIKHMA